MQKPINDWNNHSSHDSLVRLYPNLFDDLVIDHKPRQWSAGFNPKVENKNDNE